MGRRKAEHRWTEHAAAAGPRLWPVVVVGLAVVALGWGVHTALAWLLPSVGLDDRGWDGLASSLHVRSATLRLLVFGGLDVAAAFALWPRVSSAFDRAERRSRKARKALGKHHRRAPAKVRAALGLGVGTAAVVLAAALLLQPTLVPMRLDGPSWVERAANLVDGTSSAAVVDTAVWVARAMHPRPVRGVDPVAVDRLSAGLDQPTVPLMDRWDEALLAAADGDRELFARTKAVMWVESGGRQYAVSSTGCLGLMQFCASTARTRPVHAIFGRGQVTACGCRSCGVPRDVANALETDPGAVARVQERFPCPLTDARFDPDKAIRAGAAWVERLGRDVGDNLLLVYVSYNSGPAVGRAVFRAVGQRGDVTLDEIRPHLASALAPHYGSSAAGRAQGLLDVHLPKLQRAYERWR